MQTFLPLPTLSGACLDPLRLGKQRVEAFQIYLALTNPGYGWQHHPAVKMWRGYTGALCAYGRSCCDEWTARGYRNSISFPHLDVVVPPWVGGPIHETHRAALLIKAEDDWLFRGDDRALKHYAQYDWGPTPLTYTYYWP